MKTTVKTLVVAAIATLSANFANAEEPTTTPTKAKPFDVGMFASANTTKMNLTVANYAKKPLTINLKDEKGRVLYTDNIASKTASYLRKFEMGELAEGNYQFEVTDGAEVITKEVLLGQPKAKPNFEVAMYRLENSLKAKLLVNNNGANYLDISLRNAEGETLYAETLKKDTPKYRRNFNLADLKDGSYSFIISNGSQSVVKELNISSDTNRSLVAIN